MLSAHEARNRVPPKNQIPVEEYLGTRIAESSAQGFYSTKAWLGKDRLDEAETVLKKAGYQFEILQEDVRRVQLLIKWSEDNG